MAKTDRVAYLRASIAEIVEDHIPASDARRVMSDVDELIEMLSAARRDKGGASSWDGREFS